MKSDFSKPSSPTPGARNPEGISLNFYGLFPDACSDFTQVFASFPDTCKTTVSETPVLRCAFTFESSIYLGSFFASWFRAHWVQLLRSNHHWYSYPVNVIWFYFFKHFLKRTFLASLRWFGFFWGCNKTIGAMSALALSAFCLHIPVRPRHGL